MTEQKRRPPRRKAKGNTGISASHITVWTMNHEPLHDDIVVEVEAFLAKLVKDHSQRIFVQFLKQ